MPRNQVPSFLPSTSGFHFGNSFPPGTPYPAVWLPVINVPVVFGDAGNGLCGGFVFTVMDLFQRTPRIAPPAQTAPPASNTSKFDYIVKRLLASFGTSQGFDNAARLITWIQSDERALASAMVKVEWPAIRADIDAGRLSPLMLVAPPQRAPGDLPAIVTTLPNCHQVLAYGYDIDAIGNLTLRIYDPNSADHDDVTLKTNVANAAAAPLPISSTINMKLPVRAFFRTHYQPADPLPFHAVAGLQLDLLAHLQGIGDRHFQAEEFAGIRGQGKRLEGFQLTFDPPVPGLGLKYMAHVEGVGDTPWVPEGQFVGTRGQGRRLEGFAIQLTGPNAARYDLKYLAHVQNVGDMGPLHNGEFVGTRGRGLRVEGMQVWVNSR